MPKKTSVLHIEQFHDSHSHEDFYANTMQGHLQTRHKDIALPHSHDFYLAMLFTKGNGFHEIDFTTYAIKPGTLFFLNPGQTHHWELSEDTEGYIFFHTQEFYDLYYTHNRINRFPFFYSMHQSPVVYCDALTDTIERLFKWILEENSNDKILKKEALTSLIDLVYTESSRIYQQQNPAITDSHNSYYTKFREFEALVEKHFRELKLPSAYASLLAMTSRHLNRITQSVIGKTAGDVILDRVLLEAKKLLVLKRESFNEIAHSLGYEDYAYFSRLFKNKTGETPTEFLSKY